MGKMFIIFAAVIHLIYGLSESEILQKGLSICQDECWKRTPVSDAVVHQVLTQFKPVNDESLMKYVGCVTELMWYVLPNGTYIPETMKQSASIVYGSHMFDNLIDLCTKQPIPHDGVASAWQLIQCLMHNAPADAVRKFIEVFWKFPQSSAEY